jgi:hypothetical protein
LTWCTPNPDAVCAALAHLLLPCWPAGSQRVPDRAGCAEAERRWR